MNKLLHIIATPRGEESRTLKVSGVFLDAFKASHGDWMVEELNLFEETLPELTVKRVDGKYMLLAGGELSGAAREAWAGIIAHIERFMSADAYLISTPMWNFNIPYKLKHYIDVIIQPKYMFRYTETGPVGLVKDKKMVVIASRGGDYSVDQFRAFDHQESYLRTIFGFVGVRDIRFIIAQPMDAMGPEVRTERLKEGMAEAKRIAVSF